MIHYHIPLRFLSSITQITYYIIILPKFLYTCEVKNILSPWFQDFELLNQFFTFFHSVYTQVIFKLLDYLIINENIFLLDVLWTVVWEFFCHNFFLYHFSYRWFVLFYIIFPLHFYALFQRPNVIWLRLLWNQFHDFCLLNLSVIPKYFKGLLAGQLGFELFHFIHNFAWNFLGVG